MVKLCHKEIPFNAGMHKKRGLLLDTCQGSSYCNTVLAGMDAGAMTDICCAYRAHTSAAGTSVASCVESTRSYAVPAGIDLAYCQHDPLIANMHQHRTCTAFDGLTLKQIVIESCEIQAWDYNYLRPSVET